MKVNANPLLLGGLVIAIAIAILLFLDRPTVETIKTVTEVDTMYVVKAETLWVRRDTVIYLPTPSAPDTSVVTGEGDTLATYTETYSDSLVDIRVSVTVKGLLRDWGLRYSLHVPVVRQDTTIYIERSVETVRTIKQWSLNLGATGAVYTDPLNPLAVKFSFGPKVSLVTKDHKVLSYSYLLNGSHIFGITTPLTTR
jgi:hypothetical protein